MNEARAHIIQSKLDEGEALLWAHIISYEKPFKIKSKPNKHVKRVSNFVFVMLFMALFYSTINSSVSRGAESFLLLLLVLAWVISPKLISSTLISSTSWGQAWEARTDRPIFQNIIVTDKRILMFNHSMDPQQELLLSETEGVALDYENGSRALAVSAKNVKAAFIIIGHANFSKALNVIEQALPLKPIKP